MYRAWFFLSLSSGNCRLEPPCQHSLVGPNIPINIIRVVQHTGILCIIGIPVFWAMDWTDVSTCICILFGAFWRLVTRQLSRRAVGVRRKSRRSFQICARGDNNHWLIRSRRVLREKKLGFCRVNSQAQKEVRILMKKFLHEYYIYHTTLSKLNFTETY